MDIISKLLEALRDIAEMTDPDKPGNYRGDDREGCLDTVFAVASEAIRPTPVAGDEAIVPADDVEGDSRLAPEPDR